MHGKWILCETSSATPDWLDRIKAREEASEKKFKVLPLILVFSGQDHYVWPYNCNMNICLMVTTMARRDMIKPEPDIPVPLHNVNYAMLLASNSDEKRLLRTAFACIFPELNNKWKLSRY